jgi:hypothetical protein
MTAHKRLYSLMILAAAAGCGQARIDALTDRGSPSGGSLPGGTTTPGGGGQPPGTGGQDPSGETPLPGSPAGLEPNGVKQIYATSTAKAAPWTLGFGDWQARTLKFGTISGTGKDTVVQQAGQVRMSVTSVENTCEGITDHALALQRGYMCTANDWYNYEMTGYLQLVTAAGDSGDQDWTFYGGGGRHTGDGPPTGCMGSAYKASYHYASARVRFGKESWHVNYDYGVSWQPVAGGLNYNANKDRWLGMKNIRYEFTRNGKRGIRNEIWLDLGGIDAQGNPANDWKRVHMVEDHPDVASWGDGGSECGVANNQIMLWGGPHVTFRWDNTTSRLRLMSVREIVPPTGP